MKSDIGIFSFARVQSERCPNKMLRPFLDTTLTDIVLGKLAKFGGSSFFAGYEKEFQDKSLKAGVRFVKRDKRSINIDEPITEILSFLKGIDFKYLLIVNACLPFLTVKTISNFLASCKKAKSNGAFSVVLRRNFFMDIKRRPLNFKPSLKTINTKAVLPVYEFAHALYFFNKDYFFKYGRYWDWKRVRLIEIKDRNEIHDIDTEEDFRLTESLYKIRKAQGRE